MTLDRKFAPQKARTTATLAAILVVAIRAAGTPVAVIPEEALGADRATPVGEARDNGNLPDATLKTTPECNR
jgi:hypothetical protein